MNELEASLVERAASDERVRLFDLKLAHMDVALAEAQHKADALYIARIQEESEFALSLCQRLEVGAQTQISCMVQLQETWSRLLEAEASGVSNRLAVVQEQAELRYQVHFTQQQREKVMTEFALQLHNLQTILEKNWHEVQCLCHGGFQRELDVQRVRGLPNSQETLPMEPVALASDFQSERDCLEAQVAELRQALSLMEYEAAGQGSTSRRLALASRTAASEPFRLGNRLACHRVSGIRSLSPKTVQS
ncbi:unnamed protein product [Effrenium voratum]|nr:unnamed protein product [Effrenium voratum]